MSAPSNGKTSFFTASMCSTRTTFAKNRPLKDIFTRIWSGPLPLHVDPDLDPNVIRREANETQDSVEPPETQTLSPPQLLSRVRKFPRTLSNLLLNESNRKVGRIDRRRRVVQITAPEL